MKCRPYYSSPCMMNETDPTYHGFSSEQETANLLLQLLHAERAGAKVCTQLRREAPNHKYEELLCLIGNDEVASCKALIQGLSELNISGDKIVGDFFDKCMALEGFYTRLEFLNVGQRWVVKKITKALPQIQNRFIHQQLSSMLDDHIQNIDRLTNCMRENE